MLRLWFQNTFSVSSIIVTVWKVSKYGVFSGPYSARIQENTDKKKLRIWTLHAVCETRLVTHTPTNITERVVSNNVVVIHILSKILVVFNKKIY